jgi:[ribosomal protein S18]-alanine N-acetyltransferase
MRRLLSDESPNRPSGSALRFRRLRGDDLPRVMEIENAAFAHPWSLDLFQREMTHDWSTVLLATENRDRGGEPQEVIIGFVIFWLVHDEVHILNVAVARELRRHGVGRALMQEAHRRGREQGAVLATLEVRRSNAAAIDLYRGLGYRQVGIRSRYYVDEGEDAVLMVADL